MLRGLILSARSCLGDKYPGDPANMVLVPREDVWLINLAKPKSVSTVWRVIVSTYRYMYESIVVLLNSYCTSKHHTYHDISWFHV